MPLVVRMGDVNSAGGVATSGVFTVLANGRPVVPPGTRVTPHPCCGAKGCGIHCGASTTMGAPRVLAGGRPVVFVGSPDTCGHSRATGSPNVIVGL
jgi:uncharacterized Zn-binding protein involved in type VI secretion